MVQHDALLRIFWPLDIASPAISGVLVGWRNSPSDLLIVSVLESAGSRTIETALRNGIFVRDSPFPFDMLIERCGCLPLEVLGLLNPEPTYALKSSKSLIAYTRPGYQIPHIERFDSQISDVQLIFFNRPNPFRMQYISLEPISLALTHNTEKLAIQGLAGNEVAARQGLEKLRIQSLAQKLRQHSIVRFSLNSKDHVLSRIINEINCCFEIDFLLQKNLSLVKRRAQRKDSISERVCGSASSFWNGISSALSVVFTQLLFPVAAKIFIHVLMALRIFSEIALRVIGWRFGSYHMALKDISATAQQVDLRLQQFCFWPIQYMALRERRNNWKSMTDNHTEYIRFFNSLWLVANDVILGVAIGSFILQNVDILAVCVNSVIDTWSTSGLYKGISWLTNNPGGLKLNNELGHFLGNLFQFVIEYWANCMNALEPSFPLIVRLIAFASFGGATLPIALCSDLVSLFTLHIHCFYVASARIYRWQLLAIYSLFHLFRGKKRNILRNRIDSCDYELDQLLLGTILFTLLSFLLPTVLVFYSTFALARSAIIVLKAILDTMLAALNHFPLFALMLRVKDSGRLPGGVSFELRDTPSAIVKQGSATHCTSYIFLKSTPLPIKAIFREYSEFGNRTRRYYFSAAFLSSFATGRFVPSLHRRNLYGLQYSMLPARRIGVKALWKRLGNVATVSKATGETVNGTYSKHNHNNSIRRPYDVAQPHSNPGSSSD